MADIDTGMDSDELKQLLKKATKDSPMSCAFGLGTNNTVALLLLHKTKGPKGVERDLEKKYKDISNVRFGVAFVEETEPKEVKFRINKTISGFARKLAKSLRIATTSTYNKAVILLDDGTVVDRGEDKDEQQPRGGESRPQATQQPTEQDDVPPPPPLPEPEPEAPAYDKGELERQLTMLKSQLEDAKKRAPELGPQLDGYVKDAQNELNFNQFTYAASNIEQLRRALAAIKAGADGKAKKKFEECGELWDGVRRKLQAELDTLRDEILATYKSSPLVSQIEAAYVARTEPVLDMLDESLSLKLQSASRMADPEPRRALAAEALALADGYKQFVASDQTIKDLDANPFTPLALQSTIGTMLDAIKVSIKIAARPVK